VSFEAEVLQLELMLVTFLQVYEKYFFIGSVEVVYGNFSCSGSISFKEIFPLC
jgi:hypothetical protein